MQVTVHVTKAELAHIVGTMLWGAPCAVAVRWSKL